MTAQARPQGGNSKPQALTGYGGGHGRGQRAVTPLPPAVSPTCCRHRRPLTCVHNFLGATQGPSQASAVGGKNQPQHRATAVLSHGCTVRKPMLSAPAPPPPPGICTPTGSPRCSHPGARCIRLMRCDGRAVWGRLVVLVPCLGGHSAF